MYACGGPLTVQSNPRRLPHAYVKSPHLLHFRPITHSPPITLTS